MSAKTSFTFYYCIFNLYKKFKCSLVEDYLFYFVCVSHMCVCHMCVFLWAPGSWRSNSGTVPKVYSICFLKQAPSLVWKSLISVVDWPANPWVYLSPPHQSQGTNLCHQAWFFVFVCFFVFMSIWRNELITSLTKPPPQPRESYFRIIVSTFPYFHALVNVEAELEFTVLLPRPPQCEDHAYAYHSWPG